MKKHRFIFLFAEMLCLAASAMGQSRQSEIDFRRIALLPPKVEAYFQARCAGRPVFDLSAAKLKVFENGTEITDYTIECSDTNAPSPSSVALVVDASYRMRDGASSGIQLEADMINSFAAAMDSSIDEAAIIAFNDQATVIQDFTNRRSALVNKVDYTLCHGESALWNGIHTGVKEVIANAKGQCRAVIVVTDGTDHGSTITVEEIIRLANRNHIRLFPIVLPASGAVLDAMKHLATATGGTCFIEIADPWNIVPAGLNFQRIIRRSFEECRVTYDIPCMPDPVRTVIVALDNFCDSSATASLSYTINPARFILNLPDTVQTCEGDLRVFEAAPGYAHYRWSTGDSTQTLVVLQAGTYTVTVTDKSGCTYLSNPVTVIQHKARIPIITLTPDKSIICLGDSVELNAGPGFIRYLWCTGQTGQRIFVKDQNRYCVGVADSNGCASTQSVYITVLLPPAVPAITRKDDALTSDPATAYQWYLDDIPLVGETAQTIRITKTGRYNVAVTNASGCSTISHDYDVVSLGISELFTQKTFDLYPEPNDGVVTVQWSMEHSGSAEFVVTDILGKQRLADRGYYAVGPNSRSIDLSSLPSGMYFIHILGGAEHWVRKIVRD